ncbi:LysR family transcriptional regulator [Pseudochelatococcus contaminans]|uniref:DNA-binding transcriptional LysR family regulator n=1 Tax=Pseudochelatococcus contaminans TaxID=1538103 RepID=A0A7W6EHH5_9HYPH|nr:LysR family transcriptional regulator [Pseudochelatococcus contaminans]MBB3810093.1 DNA-binding transcriptional LysR family regulator [Pseudochelatococcus contaminans]
MARPPRSLFAKVNRANQVPDRRWLDLRPLHLVVAAAEHLSFSRAASILNIDKSSVSRAVRDFEDRIGVSLFERGPFGVRLTDAGKHFLDDILPAMLQIEHAIQFAGAAGRVETGTVRVGIISTLAGGFLRKLVQEYEQEHPGVDLDIRDGGRREHLRAIRGRQLDVAFLTGSGDVTDCQTLELWRERVYVAMSKAHALSGRKRLDWSDLREELFVVSRYAPGPDVRDYIVRRIADYSTYPAVQYRKAIQETLMHTVGLGRGITLVSEAWVYMPVPDLALVPLTAMEDIVPFSAVWSQRNDNPALRRFISFAKVLASNRP